MSTLDRVLKSRARLIVAAPFFGVLASYLIVKAAPEVETAATDGIHFYYAPDFIDSLTDDELLFLWAHEAMHCALKHMLRIDWRDLPEFNIACDLAINWELVRLKIGRMPADGWLDHAFAGMNAEEIYTARQQAKRQQQAQQQAGQQGQQGSAGQQAGQQGTPGAGQGQQAAQGQQAGQGTPAPGNDAGQGSSGDAGQQGQQPGGGSATGTGAPSTGQQQATAGKPGAHGGTLGGIIKPAALDAAAARELADAWETRTRQAAAVAGKSPGDMPGFVAGLLAELNRPAVLDYREIFRDFIDSRVATDYSFTTPNRRFLHTGFCLPGAVIDGIEHLVIIGDSSGSMDQTMMENGAAEMIGALDSGKVERLTIIWADVDVHAVQEFRKGDDIEGHLDASGGGGGTRFDRALAYVAEHMPDATAIVYLTDAECRHWGEEPACPILWAIHGDSRRFSELSKRAPFGRVEYVGRLE